MPRGKSSKVTFKQYAQNQPFLLPPTFDELIPENHLVRLVNSAIDKMKIDSMLVAYAGGGASTYHPKMLLKVIVYGYTQRLYSCRSIAKALRENIHFMWLSGSQHPDFRTINRFRSSRLKEHIDQVFASLMELLVEEGLVKLENYFLDGTKIEANANKYSFVWGKATRKFKARLQEQIKELLKQIDKSNEDENKQYGNKDFEEVSQEPISAEKLAEKVKELDQRLAKSPEDKELKKAVKKIKEDYLPRTEKYEQQEQILNGRNSYSKTDPDATFMRMKEDHMKNGQLKPGYNLQAGTENQFILAYSIHHNPTDTLTLAPHIDQMKRVLPKLPQNLVADSGYGSQQNYELLEKEKLTAYVKYNYFHFEKTKKFKDDNFRVDNLAYDKEKDQYICPSGKVMKHIGTRKYVTEGNYKTTREIYQAEGCSGCSLRDQCYKGIRDRKIQVSHELNAYKAKARELLESETGKKMRSKRPVEIEAVFGQIKGNRYFRRFLLRGLEKVKAEFGIIAIAHNLKKWLAKKPNWHPHLFEVFAPLIALLEAVVRQEQKIEDSLKVMFEINRRLI